MFTIKYFAFNPFLENTYLLYNENKDCIVIDPGCYFPNENQELLDFIDKSGLVPKLLLNTHCHLDHVFGNKLIAETFSLKPHLQLKEKPMLDYAPTSGLMWNVPFVNYQGDLVYVNEGERIEWNEDVLEIIETPGHSPGSICFYCKAQNFIICGDVLFRESIGRTDLPGCNHSALLKSIREKLFVLPHETIVYSGHGEPTSIGHEKKFNPFIAF